MNRDSVSRVGALAGIGQVACMIAGSAVVPLTPGFKASNEEIRQYFTAHKGGVEIFLLLMMVSLLLFGLFAAMIRQRIARAEGQGGAGFLTGAFSIGVTTAIVLESISLFTQAAMVHRVATLPDASSMRAVYEISLMFFHGGASFGLVLATGVIVVAVLRYHAMPKWQAGIAGLTCVVIFLAEIGLFAAERGGAGALPMAAFTLTIIWTLCVGIGSLLEARHEPSGNQEGLLVSA